MKKFLFSALVLAFLLPSSLKADEGMWLPMFIKRLNYVDMQKQGLQLTPEEIYNINNSSMKDAVPIFGGGCTSELVSAEGLLLTNHHCGFAAIADLSTTEHDYLRDGFWAKSKDQELQAKELQVQFFEYMEDVTNRVQAVVSPSMSEDERYQAIAKISNEIQKTASQDGKYVANVKSFYKGNEYYLFVYRVYTDVRLVGTPPQSIGKFGGNTDNWMWPRHTGDFSIFRIYADKDNNPADYSAENVPYKSKHFLPINIADKKEGDFAFIMGFPGTTQRYLTSWGIDFLVNTEYPAFVDARAKKLDIMKVAMAKDQAVRINYASAFASTSNYWKNRIGMIGALTKNKTADKKRLTEVDVQKWIDADPARKAEYGEMFDMFQKYYSGTQANTTAIQYLSQAGLSGSTLGNFGRMISTALNGKGISAEKAKSITAGLAKAYERMDVQLEKDLITGLMKHIIANVSENLLPDALRAEIKAAGSVEALAKKMENSVLYDQKEFAKIAETAPAKLKEDMVIKIFQSYYDQYLKLNKENAALTADFTKADRLFNAALQKTYEGKKVFYPDANFTMRVTYGKVLPYNPQDGVTYHYQTSTDGITQKYKKGDVEFDAPEKLLDIISAKDFGRYADSKGKMAVAFLTNHDITGGNSGSPVINGRGELIGIAFDGNWEAMSGDIEFEPSLQRTISVDIRYVLFIIDKFAGASNIIDEMTIITDAHDAKRIVHKEAKASRKSNK